MPYVLQGLPKWGRILLVGFLDSLIGSALIFYLIVGGKLLIEQSVSLRDFYAPIYLVNGSAILIMATVCRRRFMRLLYPGERQFAILVAVAFSVLIVSALTITLAL